MLVDTSGGVEDTRLEAKARIQKNPRPRTVFPKTDPLKAKDRNARGQGPRTQALVFSKEKKRSLKNNLQAILKKTKRCSNKIFRRYTKF